MHTFKTAPKGGVVILERTLCPIATDPPINEVAKFNAFDPIATQPEPLTLPFNTPFPTPTLLVPDVTEGRLDPKTKFAIPKSSVSVDVAPAIFTVELAVTIFQFPAVGLKGPPELPVIVSPTCPPSTEIVLFPATPSGFVITIPVPSWNVLP